MLGLLSVYSLLLKYTKWSETHLPYWEKKDRVWIEGYGGVFHGFGGLTGFGVDAREARHGLFPPGGERRMGEGHFSSQTSIPMSMRVLAKPIPAISCCIASTVYARRSSIRRKVRRVIQRPGAGDV